VANCLHEQEFALIIIDVPSNIAQTHFHSCAGLGVSAWLLTCLTTSTFHLSSIHVLTTLPTRLDLPHLLVTHFS
jgi:hypothetical protein